MPKSASSMEKNTDEHGWVSFRGATEGHDSREYVGARLKQGFKAVGPNHHVSTKPDRLVLSVCGAVLIALNSMAVSKTPSTLHNESQ